MAFALIMFCLCTKISFLSKNDSHPDEKYHIICAQYFTNHFLPPHHADSNIQNSYSKEGYSRLNDLDGSYWFSGKTASILKLAGFDESAWLYRFFNLLLLSIIMIRFLWLVINNDRRYLLYGCLIVLPQAWYLFSYVNDDALPLFLSLLIAELLSRSKVLGSVKHILLLGFLTGVLFLSKSNYFIFILFVGLIMIQSFFLEAKRNWKLAWIPIVGSFVIGTRYVIDFLIHGGFNRSKWIQEMVVNTARNDYSGLSILNKTFMMKDQAVTIKEMIFKYCWLENSLKSTYGVFGKMDRFLPHSFYWFALIPMLIGLIFFFYYVLKQSNRINNWNLIWFVGCTFLMFYFSFDNSWTFDFQPQGRYLFPLIVPLGMVFYWNKSALKTHITWIFLFTLATSVVALSILSS